MRIERVETVAYSLPFTEPYATARGEIREREMVLLRLRTDAGFEGLGEAVPLALRGVSYRPMGAAALLRRNLLIYGLGGIVAPFIGIKAIDLVLTGVGLS